MCLYKDCGKFWLVMLLIDWLWICMYDCVLYGCLDSESNLRFVVVLMGFVKSGYFCDGVLFMMISRFYLLVVLCFKVYVVVVLFEDVKGEVM